MLEQDFSAYGSLSGVHPVMVSGVYRSATTFVAALLGSHPRLRASSSAVKYLRFCIDCYGDLSDPKNRHLLISDCQRRLQTRWNLELDVDAIVDSLNQYMSANTAQPCSDAVVYHYLMCYLHGIDPAINDVAWVDKTALQWSSIPLFLAMFPQGRVVHVIRDPRDVTASYKKMTFEPGNTFLDAAFNCRSSMELAEQLTPAQLERVLIMRVEDLSPHPNEQLQSLYDFLGLQFSPDLLNVETFNAAGEDWRSNTSFGTGYQSWPKPESRWPSALTKAEVQFVELITQPYLHRYGYASSGQVPSADDWQAIDELLDSDFLRQRFRRWFTEGKGSEGYRTNPVEHELRLVFPERYGLSAASSEIEG